MVEFNKEKCEQRNRIAARRDHVTAYPLTFLRQPSLKEAKSREQALKEEHGEVYIRYMEAANDGFIPDRSMFLGESTLLNIASDANAGFAFMNSHRTGGLSHEAELPMGYSFYGRFGDIEDERGRRRGTTVGIYMIPGLSPNGENGPSTDDLYKMIETGTIRDVSVGLHSGWNQCDICGSDLNAYDEETGEWLCKHYPGTTYNMTKAEIKSQIARGVLTGVASYTYQDGRCGETSAVYDGAIAYAGFQKSLNAFRRGDLPDVHCREARGAFSRFLYKGEFEPMENENKLLAAIHSLTDTMKQYFSRTPAPAPPPTPVETSEKESLQAEVSTPSKEEVEALREERNKLRLAAATSLVTQAVEGRKLHRKQVESALALAQVAPEEFALFLEKCDPIVEISTEAQLNQRTLDDTLTEGAVTSLDPVGYFAFRKEINEGRKAGRN